MIGTKIAPVATITTVSFDQHHLAGAPAAGKGRVGDRYWDSTGRKWYKKINATTWVLL